MPELELFTRLFEKRVPKAGDIDANGFYLTDTHQHTIAYNYPPVELDPAARPIVFEDVSDVITKLPRLTSLAPQIAQDKCVPLDLILCRDAGFHVHIGVGGCLAYSVAKECLVRHDYSEPTWWGRLRLVEGDKFEAVGILWNLKTGEYDMEGGESDAKIEMPEGLFGV